MALQFSTTLLDGRLDAITTAVGSGGFLEIYTGTIPAHCATATSGTLLATLPLGTPFAPASSAGVLTPTLPTTANASNTNTAGYWRIFKSDNSTCVVQGSVGTSGADLNLNTLSLVSGGPVQITSFTITEGGA
jgi:hypothetical protein